MRKKTKAQRIADRERIIKKRMKIADSWKNNSDDENQYEGREGKLHKYNMSCGCFLCKPWKKQGNAKGRLKHSDIKKLINNETYEE